jgi:hypothetical protein
MKVHVYLAISSVLVVWCGWYTGKVVVGENDIVALMAIPNNVLVRGLHMPFNFYSTSDKISERKQGSY